MISLFLLVCLSIYQSIYAHYMWLCWPSDWRMSECPGFIQTWHWSRSWPFRTSVAPPFCLLGIHDLPFDREDRVWASCCKMLQILAERCCHQSSVEPTFAEIVNLKEISSGVNWSKAMATLPIFWEVSHSLPDLGAPLRGLPEAAVPRHAWEDVDAWEFCMMTWAPLQVIT